MLEAAGAAVLCAEPSGRTPDSSRYCCEASSGHETGCRACHAGNYCMSRQTESQSRAGTGRRRGGRRSGVLGAGLWEQVARAGLIFLLLLSILAGSNAVCSVDDSSLHFQVILMTKASRKVVELAPNESDSHSSLASVCRGSLYRAGQGMSTWGGSALCTSRRHRCRFRTLGDPGLPQEQCQPQVLPLTLSTTLCL